MNRHERRKAAATSRGQTDRQRTIADAASFLNRAAETDRTISGATLMLPSGETIYLPASEPSEVTQ